MVGLLEYGNVKTISDAGEVVDLVLEYGWFDWGWDAKS